MWFLDNVTSTKTFNNMGSPQSELENHNTFFHVSHEIIEEAIHQIDNITRLRQYFIRYGYIISSTYQSVPFLGLVGGF